MTPRTHALADDILRHSATRRVGRGRLASVLGEEGRAAVRADDLPPRLDIQGVREGVVILMRDRNAKFLCSVTSSTPTSKNLTCEGYSFRWSYQLSSYHPSS